MEILSHIHAHTHKDTHPEVKWVLVVDVFFGQWNLEEARYP